MAEVYTDSIRAKVNNEVQDVPIRDTTKSPAIIPTVTGTGEVTITDASDNTKLQNLTMHGNTEQTQTTGAQLIPFPYTDKPGVISGINVNVNDDGSVDVNGTTTDGFNFIFANNLTLYPGAYTCSLNKEGTGNLNFLVYDGESVLNNVSNTFTVEEVKNVQVYLNAENAGVTANFKCYPMLNAGSESLPYEPYTERYPSPRPEIPSKNLLDYSLIQNKTMNGITFTNNNDGTFTVNGTATAQAYTDVLSIDLSPGTYYVSSNLMSPASDPVFMVGKRTAGSSDSYSDVRNGAITITDTDEVRAYINVNNGITADNVTIYPMIEKGSTETFWEPYGTIEAHPQEIVSAGKHIEATEDTEEQWQYEIGVGGVQLIPFPYFNSSTQSGGVTYKVSENGEVEYYGTITSPGTNFYFASENFLLDAGQYTLSYKGELGDNISLRAYNNDLLTTIGVVNPTLTFTLDAATNVRIYLNSPMVGSTVNGHITPMLNKGSEPLPFEPYRTQQSALLTTTRPLTKWDKLEKRNGQWGWVYKSVINKITQANKGVTWNNIDCETYAPNAEISLFGEENYCYSSASNGYGYSNYWDDVTSSNSNGSATSLNMNTVFGKTLTTQEGEQWVEDVENEGNPLILVYEGFNETFVPLPEEEQYAMDALVMYAPTSIVSADTGDLSVELEVSYIADTTTYLTANFVPKSDYNALEARVSALESAAVNNVTEQ